MTHETTHCACHHCAAPEAPKFSFGDLGRGIAVDVGTAAKDCGTNLLEKRYFSAIGSILKSKTFWVTVILLCLTGGKKEN